jgi:hypothetical protein
LSGYGRQIIVTSAIAAVLVIGLGVGLYYATPTSNYSIQRGGDQTVSATHVSTINAMSSTSSIFQTTPGGQYTYSPSSEVKILSVQAFVSQAGSGEQTLTFSVEFQNIGNSTIYVVTGGRTSLNATILSGPVRTQYAQTAKCQIVSPEIPIGRGGNFTSSTPSCSSGFIYVLLQPGTIEVELTLSWSANTSTGGVSGGVIDIMAEFTLN